MPEKAFSQRPVEAFHDALVPVDVKPTAPILDRVLCQLLTHCTHQLAPRVNLKELRPPQGAPLVNPSQAIGDLCRSLASQGLSLLVAAGDVNGRESIAEGLPSYAVMWQEEQVGLMDLVWYRHVKFRPWYVPMACFYSQSLACCSVTLAAAEIFLMTASPFQYPLGL